MSTSQCAVYQVKETPEYRDVRFRSYEKLRSEGKSVSIENYQQVYIGRIQPGETPADIKIRLQKQRPKNFKGHSIGCSDVLVITDEGKTTAYYINKDGFIIVPEFLTIKSSSDTRLSIDTTGYEIEGKKGTWLAQDYILMNEKKWFLMEHEEYGTRAAYVILSEDGAVVMNDCYNGFDEEARRNIQNFMQQQAAKEQERQKQQQVQSQMQPNQTQQPPEQQKKKPELANWQKVMDNGEYLRSAEMAEEANYNMIDGLMNNTPKKKDKNKPRESVLARLRLNQKKVAKQGASRSCATSLAWRGALPQTCWSRSRPRASACPPGCPPFSASWPRCCSASTSCSPSWKTSGKSACPCQNPLSTRCINWESKTIFRRNSLWQSDISIPFESPTAWERPSARRARSGKAATTRGSI